MAASMSTANMRCAGLDGQSFSICAGQGQHVAEAWGTHWRRIEAPAGEYTHYLTAMS